MSLHNSNLASMTAAWLLPVVSTIVAAASGGIVAEVLPNPDHALWTVIASYTLWGTGVPLAMTILVVYFTRLTIHHLPPREVIVSVFLPLGPLGQGGFAVMQLGKVSMQLFPRTGTLLGLSSGETLYSVGFLMAIIMWGYGVVWLFFAVASISRSKFPFNMGWWGFTFPLGVFAVATDTFGKELPSTFFSVLGTVCCHSVFNATPLLTREMKIISLTVVILWFVVAVGTLKKAITGEIFYAPCLGDLKKNTPMELQTAV
jgi:tellurite resistance protein TehA-like permease